MLQLVCHRVHLQALQLPSNMEENEIKSEQSLENFSFNSSEIAEVVDDIVDAVETRNREEEENDMIVRVIENVDWENEPDERANIRERLEINDWDVDKVIDIYNKEEIIENILVPYKESINTPEVSLISD